MNDPEPTLIRLQPIVLTPHELLEALPNRRGIAYAETDIGVIVASRRGGFQITANRVLSERQWPSILARIEALAEE